MAYRPETTVIMGMTRILRTRTLPYKSVPRPTHMINHTTVEAMSVVLEGDTLSDYHVVDVAAFFRLRDPTQASSLIHVNVGDRVTVGQELAARRRRRGSKVLNSPINGLVVRVDNGRIYLQESSAAVEVKARIPGEIEVSDAGAVRVASNGALIQCAWGNGQCVYGTYRFLPDDGFVGLSRLDVRISEYRNVVIISPAPIHKGDLLVAQQQELAGVVAPSMPAYLREFALGLTFPVILTEGFGQRRPTALIYHLLQSNIGRQATFDAVAPDPWSADRPEIVIQLPSGGVLPPTPTFDLPLEAGAQVRVTRAPWDGMLGEIVELPQAPQVVENGLRLPCARVRLPDNRTVTVPLANLELLGSLGGMRSTVP